MILASLFFALCTSAPVIERPAPHAQHERIAVLLTGDGGWRKIDERIARRLGEKGISTAGFNTAGYYSQERSPEEAACALEQVIRAYQSKWKSPRVVVIGYSRGADILPFLISRLPADVRGSIDLVALLGLESEIDFRYRRFSRTREPQHAVKPELEKLRGMPLLCVYGEKEKDSLCRDLDPKLIAIERQPGSHHFAGRYSEIADVILSHVAATKRAE